MLKTLIVLLVMVVLPVTVQAGKVPEKRYTLKWKEKNQRIVHRSVCYTYAEGSIPYRGCRVQAKRHFTERCRFFRAKYDKIKAPYNRPYRKKRDKFCYSADAFFPL
ncbi:MAG: hypothetical protein ACPGF7_15065 [Pontibacterium sp.]